jgi:hypothetical protein
LAREWIESENEGVAMAGWATLFGLAAIKDGADLDLVELKQLLDRVRRMIHQAPDLVRYSMVGCATRTSTCFLPIAIGELA